MKEICSFCVFDPRSTALGIAMPELFRVEKHTVKVGETMRVYWGTGYEKGWCRVNVTSNGNCWSSSANSDTNARNLNLNSSNFNWNNNNRANGFPVRPVAEAFADRRTLPFLVPSSSMGNRLHLPFLL